MAKAGVAITTEVDPENLESTRPDDDAVGLIPDPDEATMGDTKHVDLNVDVVRPVDVVPRAARGWQGGASVVPAVGTRDVMVPVMIAGHHELRRAVTIVCTHGTVGVWVGPDQNVAIGSGFPLAPGASVTIPSVAPVFAVADAASAASSVAMLHTFEDG